MPVNLTPEAFMELIQQNTALLKQVSELTAQVNELTAKIAELTESKNKNSRNSSKPPSSDGLKKKNTKRSLRESSGKKQGGQEGHEGVYMKITGTPDKTVNLIPEKCQNCPRWAKCRGEACISETRYAVDIKVTQTLTEYNRYEVCCPSCHELLQGKFPKEIKSRYQYGATLSALAVSLCTVGAVSYKRTQEILSGLIRLPLSTGTLKAMVKRCSDNLNSVNEKIRDHLKGVDIAHADETGCRVDGKTRWIHVFSDSMFTFLCYSHKRGAKGMSEAGILPVFEGTIIHDCWASYWKFENISAHGICCAHLLRELNGVKENHSEQKWTPAFFELLMDMKKAKDDALSKGDQKLSENILDGYDKRYADIIKAAYSENPLPENEPSKKGRKKKGKVRALIERLEKFKESVCLFAKNFNVAFDNNLAERDLRMIKTKSKVSGCFRTEDGIKEYLKIMSYVGSAHKHRKSAFEAIKNAFLGNPEVTFGW